MIRQPKTCPQCNGTCGSYERVRVSYYDYGTEWCPCRMCDGNGEISKQRYRTYAKRQAKFWAEEAVS